MKVTIYGAGYVGLVTAVCFAELGHKVCCVDVDTDKITMLKNGKISIYENNLQHLLQKNLQLNQLSFTDDFEIAVNYSEIQIIAVGTPSKKDGSVDLQYVEAVAMKLGEYISSYKCIVSKSTVPVGTAEKIRKLISSGTLKRNVSILFDVVSNPEFLREGEAIHDFMSPMRIVIGIEHNRALRKMKALYQPLIDRGYPLVAMDALSAELTKYAANAFLATKISFINEMSQIAERTGANIDFIKRGIGMDTRINESFLNAGCGFGGSCFPKDLLALRCLSKEINYEPHILHAVLKTNDQQQALLFYKLLSYFHYNLKDKTIALWGLAFKPNTDDIRCATSRVVMEMLWNAGAIIQAYDPMAMKNIFDIYGAQSNLVLHDDALDALSNADALVIVTEWNEFRNPDFGYIKKTLTYPAIFDGRNIYNANLMEKMGFDYFAIGFSKMSALARDAKEKLAAENLV